MRFLRLSAWGVLVSASVLIATCVGVDSQVRAATTTPTTLNYQGRLTDASGAPMPDGFYNMRFRAYNNEPTGGTPTWTETHDGPSGRVEVKNGVFSTKLGEIMPFSSTAFAGYTIYIEVELPTPLTAQCDSTPATNCSPSWTEGPMLPRQPIATQGYAMNADLIDGIDGANLAQFSANATYTGSNIFRSSSDSTTAFQIQKSDTTPLLVADTQNLALKVGGGDVSPDANPALLVFDYSTSYGDPFPQNGAIYYRDTAGRLRCSEANEWKGCVYQQPTIQNAFNYKQEMMYGAAMTAGNTVNLDSTISMVNAGTGSALTSQTSEQHHPGIWRMSTGTTTTGSSFITSSRISGSLFTPYRIGEGEWTLSTGVRITTEDVSAATNRYGFYFGLTTVAYSTNGCVIRYVFPDYSGDWAGYCGNGVTESKCDITDGGAPGLRPVVAGTWYHLRININSAGTAVTFTVNDAYSCTITGGDIPLNTNLAIRLGIIKVAGSTARTADVDYLDFTYTTPNR